MVPKGSNSGVYFKGRYEVQILDSLGRRKTAYGDCGGIYQRWKDRRGYEGHPPRVNARRQPGEWQTFDVIFRAPRGSTPAAERPPTRTLSKSSTTAVVIHENVEVTGPTRSAAFETDEKPRPAFAPRRSRPRSVP